MKTFFSDMRLLFGIIMAHALLLFSFHDTSIFWYIFSGAVLVLILYANYQVEMDHNVPFTSYATTGIISGLLLYFLFRLGREMIGVLPFGFVGSIRKMYRWYGPSQYWEFLALIVIAAPGEEFFWRGFIQKRLLKHLKPAGSIIGSSLLYSSANIYSGSFILIIATFISGLFWGLLYLWRKSMPLVIVSHIVFDVMIFVIWPLK